MPAFGQKMPAFANNNDGILSIKCRHLVHINVPIFAYYTASIFAENYEGIFGVKEMATFSPV
jgi:hypothetical protein